MDSVMSKNRIDKTPFILAGIIVLTVFFLSCTKKPQQAANDNKDGRNPANNMYTTPHGFKVQFEPAVVAPQKK
jgi:hypothetical protein